ncbi:MAG: 50S ribosomal protein L10 [Frankiales bacterium]|nr:50S ribosomal protein L10 [Frankiales bacterium]
MARADKAADVAEIAEHFRSSTATVLTEYRGLTVAQLKTLRRSLGETTSYAVVKNTLTKIAAAEAGVEGLDSLLTGPSALAFVKGDPVEAAKGLRDFAKANPLLVIKGGYMDGKTLSAAEIAKLADLESREVLLAKLAGAMKASLSQAAALFQAPLSQAARTIEALRVKAEADPSVIGGAGAAAPAADAADVAGEPAAEAAPVAEDAAAPAEAEATAATDAPAAEADAEATEAPAAEAEAEDGATTEG